MHNKVLFNPFNPEKPLINNSFLRITKTPERTYQNDRKLSIDNTTKKQPKFGLLAVSGHQLLVYK